MAKKRPRVSSLGGISREEAENIGKRVTVPTPTPAKKVVEKNVSSFEFARVLRKEPSPKLLRLI